MHNWQYSNATGQLTGISDDSGSSGWLYNSTGQLSSQAAVINGSSYTLNWDYDSLNRLISARGHTGSQGIRGQALNLARHPAGMQQLNGIYTQYVNRHYHRCGHVFQGRFKSILVDTDVYYKTLVRYVLQNPLRASMVTQLVEYDWSSYRATTGNCTAPDWLVVDDVLANFDADRAKAVVAFEAFCDHIEETGIWDNLTNQIFLGDEAFTKAQLSKLTSTGVMSDISKVQRRPTPLPLPNYEQQYSNRNEAILAAYRSGAYSMTQLATYFQLHVSTVSKLVAKFKA